MAKRAAPDTLETPRNDGPEQPTIDDYQVGEYTNMTSEEFENTLMQFDHNKVQETQYLRGVVKSHLELRSLLYAVSVSYLHYVPACGGSFPIVGLSMISSISDLVP